MKYTILKRTGRLNDSANNEPDLIINGLKNFHRTNPSPMFFNASPMPTTDTLRRFNLSIFAGVNNPQNPLDKTKR